MQFKLYCNMEERAPSARLTLNMHTKLYQSVLHLAIYQVSGWVINTILTRHYLLDSVILVICLKNAATQFTGQQKINQVFNVVFMSWMIFCSFHLQLSIHVPSHQILLFFLFLQKNQAYRLNRKKNVFPTTKLTFLGVELDSELMEVRLPKDKLEKLKTILSSFLHTKKVTLIELQSLIGFLNFAYAVVSPGHAFLRRIIDLTWCPQVMLFYVVSQI